MAGKFRIDFDSKPEEKLDDEMCKIRDAFSTAAYELYNTVAEKLKACERANIELSGLGPDKNLDEETLALLIADADSDTLLETTRTLFGELIKTEEPMSKLWIECYTRTGIGINMSHAAFKTFNDIFNDDRKDVNDAIVGLKERTQTYDQEFKDQLKKILDDYRLIQEILLADEAAVKRKHK